MEQGFDQILDSLRNQELAVLSSQLPALSDLDRSQIERLQSLWQELPAPRRRSLIRELGRLADDHFEFTFERINRFAIHDPDPEVRCCAIQNLWECEDPKLVPPLLAALSDDADLQVRAAAAAALARFVYLGEINELPQQLLRRIEDALIKVTTETPNPDVRKGSLEALGFSSRQEVTPLIMQAYDSGEEDLMVSALLAMGRSASKQWKPQVLAEVRNPSPTLRAQAAWSAGELELRESAPDLIDLLGDADEEVRRGAAWSLGQLGGTEAQRALSALLNRTEDQEEISWIEDALDHLAFVDNTRDFLLLEFDEPEEPSN